jgi:GNAT superfamily N-acetyltransferase
VASGDRATFCGRCGLNLKLLRVALVAGNAPAAADAFVPAEPATDLPALGLSVYGLEAVEALWSEVSCTSPGKVNISRRDLDGFPEYMQLFLRGSCLRITCSKTKTHVAHQLVKGKRVGEIVDKPRLVASLIFHLIDGPTFLGYADTLSNSGREPLARLLADSDREEFERVRAATGSDDGLAWGRPVAAVYVGGRIVSAAGYRMRDDRVARLGVATLPEFRRRRFASECVIRVAQEAVAARLILEYQTEKGAAASMALARRLGFAPFAEKIFITFKE